MKILPFRKKPFVQLEGKSNDVYFGATSFMISGACLQYAMQEYNQHSEWAAYFRTSFSPDELFFQTIIFNSDFADKAIRLDIENCQSAIDYHPLHYVEYVGYTHIFDEQDFDKLMDSGKMFARKLQSGVSEKLIEMIDARRAE
jgi:hypothetical protein